MPAQRKYPEELRERAVKMVLEIRSQDGKGFGEGELRGPGRVSVALTRIPHQLELLRPADRHHR
jgi:hypothetical protein